METQKTINLFTDSSNNSTKFEKKKVLNQAFVIILMHLF